jgi:crotonobetainyl-CoA:carnitine CoA-transferase CaiB-like acyl-CoA transferase
MTPSQILHNVRILDFTWVLAGPYATRLLADFGAEVIKVMPVGAPPPSTPFERAYQGAWNRNKRAITLNPGLREGKDLAKRLVAVSDVVIENFTPRVMANWGFDYESLRRVKPAIIAVGMSYKGHDGPDSGQAGFAPTVHAAAGLTGLVASPDGDTLGPGFSYADHVAGLFASMAVLAALEHRDATGEGQFVDISQQEALLTLMGEAFAETAAPPAVPDGLYPCRDGRWCAVTVADDAAWQRLVGLPGAPGRFADERYRTLEGRLRHRDELNGLVLSWTRTCPAAEVEELLRSHGIAAGIVLDAAGLFTDPQLKARQFLLDRPDLGPLVDASPIRFSDTPASYETAAPLPGADNDDIYGALLGLPASQRAALRSRKVI